MDTEAFRGAGLWASSTGKGGSVSGLGLRYNEPRRNPVGTILKANKRADPTIFKQEFGRPASCKAHDVRLEHTPVHPPSHPH